MTSGWKELLHGRVVQHGAKCAEVRNALNEIISELEEINLAVTASEANVYPERWEVCFGGCYEAHFGLDDIHNCREVLAREQLKDQRRANDVSVKDALIYWFLTTFTFE